jgi:hypothetical protein
MALFGIFGKGHSNASKSKSNSSKMQEATPGTKARGESVLQAASFNRPLSGSETNPMLGFGGTVASSSSGVDTPPRSPPQVTVVLITTTTTQIPEPALLLTSEPLAQPSLMFTSVPCTCEDSIPSYNLAEAAVDLATKGWKKGRDISLLAFVERKLETVYEKLLGDRDIDVAEWIERVDEKLNPVILKVDETLYRVLEKVGLREAISSRQLAALNN